MSVMANDLNRFRSDAESFADSTRDLRRFAEELSSEFESLQRMWEGEAHDVLQRRFTDDYRSLESLVSAMEKASSNLNEAVQTYTSCEGDVSTRIDSLRI